VLPSSLRTLLAYAMLSDPGRPFAPDPLAALRCSPRDSNGEDASFLRLSRLYHMARTMAVYASCRLYGDYAKLASGGGSAFPGGLFHTHRVRPESFCLRSPLPGLLLARWCSRFSVLLTPDKLKLEHQTGVFKQALSFLIGRREEWLLGTFL
jgi:hypothetical protein